MKVDKGDINLKNGKLILIDRTVSSGNQKWPNLTLKLLIEHHFSKMIFELLSNIVQILEN